MDLTIKPAYIVEGIVFNDLKDAQDHVIKAKLFGVLNGLSMSIDIGKVVDVLMENRDKIVEILNSKPKAWSDQKINSPLVSDIIKEMDRAKQDIHPTISIPQVSIPSQPHIWMTHDLQRQLYA